MTLLLQTSENCHPTVIFLSGFTHKKTPNKSAFFYGNHTVLTAQQLFLQVSQGFVNHSGWQWNIAIANNGFLTLFGKDQFYKL